MKCAEVMKSEFECVLPLDTVQTAAQRMEAENVGFLPVCDEEDRVLGTLTDRDLALRVIAPGLSFATLVEQVMTREVIACRADDDLAIAEQLMAENHKSRILCTDEEGTVVGVISLSDIAQREDPVVAAETWKQVTDREAHP